MVAGRVIAGVGLEIKTLVIIFLFAIAVGVLLVGPRQVFASRMLCGRAR